MSDQPECIFETIDYSGTPVVLGRATWQAKAGNGEVGDHPEIRDYLQDVRATIESPSLVFQSTRDERSRIFYRLGAGRGEFAGKQYGGRGKVRARGGWPTRLCRDDVSESSGIFPRGAIMAQKGERFAVMTAHYDEQADILTFTFTDAPQPAVAEEAADEVWVRYDPKTRRVITVDVLNFSARVREVFGPTLTYTERTDPQHLEALLGLPLPGRAEGT